MIDAAMKQRSRLFWRAQIRRKAFEEAAEVQPEKERNQYREGHAYNVGWQDGVLAQQNAIRALAKEKPNG